MNLGNLRTLARSYVKTATISRISNASLDLILNQGAIDVARKTKCMPADEKFDVAADTRSYDLTSNLTRYLLPDKGGLWWNNGDIWQEVYLRTREWMNKHQTSWRDDSSGSPQYYSIEGDSLSTYPKAETALTDGFWLYFFQKPPTMENSDQYPFGGGTEIARLSILSEAILLYYKIRAFKILGMKQNEVISAKQEYMAEIAERKLELAERPDISNLKKTKYSGKKVR